MGQKVMFVFIILHYVAIEQTVKAIESILETFGKKKFKIVVVDNASPNGSGEGLEQKYQDNENVDVLLLPENMGYARGNNSGCKYAEERFRPDFVIVLNNDVIIYQPDFLDRIEDIYKRERFDVLGPDIYIPETGEHQNPKRERPYTKDEVKKLLTEYERRVVHPWYVKARIFLKKRKLLKHLFGGRKQTQCKEQVNGIILHGSCVIFSHAFLAKRKYVFNESTFMYFELEILDHECRKEGYKTVYDPTIRVEHHHNYATKHSYTDEVQRVQFMNRCIEDSLRVFLQLWNDGNQENSI